MEHTTESGLAVISRADYVMFPEWLPPPQAQAWDGWPVGWAVPWDNYPTTMQARVSTVFACVDFLSRTFSSFPPYIVKDAIPQEPKSWLASPEPEVYTDWTVFAKQIVNSMLLRGEAFLYVTARGSDGWPLRFIAVSPDYVSVEAAGGGAATYAIGGEPVDRKELLHIKYQSAPGDVRGHGPLEGAAQSLIGAAALERYATDLATRGGVPWAVLKHPAKLTDVQAQDIQNGWKRASARRDGAPAVLHGGMELETLTLSPADMALLELRTFDSQQIASCFGVPAYLVGLPMPSGLTYSNATSLFDFVWRATLRPLAQSIASAISQWALPRGTELEFNRDEFTRPDFGERVQAYAQLFNVVDPVTGERALTVEEIRSFERLQPFGSSSAAAIISGAHHE